MAKRTLALQVWRKRKPKKRRELAMFYLSGFPRALQFTLYSDNLSRNSGILPVLFCSLECLCPLGLTKLGQSHNSGVWFYDNQWNPRKQPSASWVECSNHVWLLHVSSSNQDSLGRILINIDWQVKNFSLPGIRTWRLGRSLHHRALACQNLQSKRSWKQRFLKCASQVFFYYQYCIRC